MVKNLLLLLLLASSLSAQMVTDIYVTDSKISTDLNYKNCQYSYTDIIITFDYKPSYILLSCTDSIMVVVQGFTWQENGETIINNYGVKSIATGFIEYGLPAITIKFSPENVPNPVFTDIVSENSLILRFCRKSKPYISIVNQLPLKISSFPVKLAFKCVDPGKRESDTLEYRLIIKAPGETTSLCGYPIGQWTPWSQGDSGSVVFDSLANPGKYSVKIQARNKNTGVESKKVETKFKYNK